MIIKDVDFERVRSRYRDCLASLDTIEDEICATGEKTLNREQRLLVECIIELSEAASAELQKLTKGD